MALSRQAPTAYKLPRQFDAGGSETLESFVEATTEKRSVVKPNLGFGSLGVSLMTAEDARYRTDVGTLCESVPSADIDGLLGHWIAQEWVRPSTVRMNGHPYYFDVRIFTVNGLAVAGCARRAAAPALGFFEDTEISWLTTTGPALPLGVSNGQESGDVGASGELLLGAAESRRLIDAAESAATDLERGAAAVGPADYRDLCGPPVPPVRSLRVKLDRE